MDGAALGFRDRLVRRGLLVAHHRALRDARVPRRPSSPGCAPTTAPRSSSRRTGRPTSRTPSTSTSSRPTSSRRCCALFFADVQVIGLEGDDVLQADFAARREQRREAAEARRARTPQADAPLAGTCGATSTRSRRVPGARLREHRHRLRPRRLALLRHRRTSRRRRRCSSRSRARPAGSPRADRDRTGHARRRVPDARPDRDLRDRAPGRSRSRALVVRVLVIVARRPARPAARRRRARTTCSRTTSPTGAATSARSTS